MKVPAKKRPRPASDLPAASDDGSDDDDVLIQASDDDDDVLVQSGPVYKRARTEGAPVSSRFKENDVCEMLHVDKEGGKWVRVRVLAVEPGGVRCVFLAPTRKDMKTCRFLQQGGCLPLRQSRDLTRTPHPNKDAAGSVNRARSATECCVKTGK